MSKTDKTGNYHYIMKLTDIWYRVHETAKGNLCFYKAVIQNNKITWVNDGYVKNKTVNDYEENFHPLDYHPKLHDQMIITGEWC